MPLRRKLLPTANAVPANGSAGTATLDLPLGLKYHAIGLELGGVVAGGSTALTLGTTIPVTGTNLIEDVRVKLNGEVQRNAAGWRMPSGSTASGPGKRPPACRGRRFSWWMKSGSIAPRRASRKSWP
jgi:hypothetical protein